MPEILEPDFARLESEPNASEEEAVKEIRSFMHDSKTDTTGKTKDVATITEELEANLL